MRWLFSLICLPLLTLHAQDFDVAGNAAWVDTKLDVRPGDVLQVTATGTLSLPQGKTTGPAGASRGFRDLIKAYPVNTAGLGALLGRIGSNDTSIPFLLSASKRLEVTRTGRLFLGINKTANDSVSGSFKVKIEFTTRGPEVSAIPKDLKLPEITKEMVDSVPRRVSDAAGTPGDNTNFMIVGSEKRILDALISNGWVKVDRDSRSAVLTGILATLSRQAYLTIPMSELMLFGRVQDYGMAHAEPVAVVASRHHFRLWKAPFTAEGQEVWVGAGTHDIGFDRDQRNGNITHKIDPDVDQEREYIGRSLQETGQVAKLSYILPSQPNQKARTAHGEEFSSDGRVLIIHLVPESEPGGTGIKAAFSSLFCSVREKENPDTGAWDACAKYWESPASPRVDLPAIATTYRVLIVPGFFSACASGIAPAFDEGVQHLQKEHGLTVESWVPPNASSEDNAKGLAAYLRGKMLTDNRKYIVIGYSKGAPDVQTAIALEPGVKDALAAFVSVAGAIGGSPIADVLPAQAEQWVQRYKLGKCDGDVAAAFRSLKRDVRREFLSKNPAPLVPSYSIPAIAGEKNTSKMLQESWKMLAVFANRHDSQLTEEDAAIPGSKLLGTALADHLAVALPFDKAQDANIRSMADQGRYPRAALLESIVRFVSTDLAGNK